MRGAEPVQISRVCPTGDQPGDVALLIAQLAPLGVDKGVVLPYHPLQPCELRAEVVTRRRTVAHLGQDVRQPSFEHLVGRVLTDQLLLKGVALRQRYFEARCQLAAFGVHADIIGDAGTGRFTQLSEAGHTQGLKGVCAVTDFEQAQQGRPRVLDLHHQALAADPLIAHSEPGVGQCGVQGFQIQLQAADILIANGDLSSQFAVGQAQGRILSLQCAAATFRRRKLLHDAVDLDLSASSARRLSTSASELACLARSAS